MRTRPRATPPSRTASPSDLPLKGGGIDQENALAPCQTGAGRLADNIVYFAPRAAARRAWSAPSPLEGEGFGEGGTL
jgi:hypothetical protein